MSSKKIAFFTIASKNYLPYARTLFASLEAVYPNAGFFLCLADKVDGYFSPSDENFKIVEAEHIGIPDFNAFAYRYDIMEFNTATKPFMFRYLFDNSEYDAIFIRPVDAGCVTVFHQLFNIFKIQIS